MVSRLRNSAPGMSEPAATRSWPLDFKRIATVLVALLIIYVRMPENFTRPQFWAEDGAVFFRLAHEIGARGLLTPVAG